MSWPLHFASQFARPCRPVRPVFFVSSATLLPSCHFCSSSSPPVPPKPSLKFRSGAAGLPHPEKVRKGVRAVVEKRRGTAGEDAYLIAENCTSYFIGVADGVSEWKEQGIDAGMWSRSFLRETQRLIDEQKGGSLDPLQLMSTSYGANLGNRVLGSSTVCFLSFCSERSELKSANLGNSGYMILRQRGDTLEVVYRSLGQEKVFGCPFQLGHHSESNKPEDAMQASHALLPGDMVIVGSDGLFDNLGAQEIVDATSPLLRARWSGRLKTKISSAWEKLGTSSGVSLDQCFTLANSPGEVAHAVAKCAFEASMDKKRPTPYSIAASAELNLVYNGGKADDITVIVAFVEPDLTQRT